MLDPKYFILHVNPEPWAIGSVSRSSHGARISPNPNLVAFQAAVKEALEDVPMLPESYRRMTFYFWRQQAKYLDTNDKIRQRNQADATNMQKGLEDALQGILFKNDREIRDVRSVIVAQGPDVTEPGILIRAEHVGPTFTSNVLDEIPTEVLEDMLRGASNYLKEKADRWSQSDDLF